MKIHLKDIPYIDSWNEDSIERMIQTEFQEIKEDIELYQNICGESESSSGYRLKTIPKEEAKRILRGS